MNIITLKNGFRIALSKRDYVHSASICFFIGAGSRFESTEDSGVSHFIEHMLFKGTQKLSELDISERIDEMGGQLNAYTAKEYTCVYAQVLSSHLEQALDILCDMLTNPRFDPGDLDTERGVILEEIGMYEDSPEDLCSDALYESVYKNTGLMRGIAGSRESVNQMTRDHLIGFMKKYYVPERMTVSICGDFDEELVLRKMKAYFEGLENTGNPFSADPASFHASFARRHKRFEQTQLLLCVGGLPIGDSNRYAAGVLAAILGGSSSSRLTHRIRGQLGLAYSISCFCVAHIGTGLFCISAGVAHTAQEKVLRETLAILREVYENGVEDRELLRTKAQFKAGLLMGLESSSSYAAMMGRSLLLENRFIDENEMTAEVDRLTCEDLHRVAQDLLQFDKLALSIAGKPRTNVFYREIFQDFR